MPKLLLCDFWWRTISKSFNKCWQNIQMNFSFFHTEIFLRFIMDSCPIDKPDVEKPNFYLWPGTSHQSSSGLRAMIHYWLIVYDPIIDNQKWVPLILSPMSKLDSVLCKGLTFACSELSLSLFCGSDLSFLKYLSTNLKYLKSSIK